MYKTLFIEKYTQYKREATICKVQRRDNEYLSSMKGGLTLIILEIIVIAVLTVAFVKATLCGSYPVSRTSESITRTAPVFYQACFIFLRPSECFERCYNHIKYQL